MLSKVDREHFFSRAGWDLPEQVIAALELPHGARVADIGAGEGYFAFRFATAIGEGGRVYAVEVDERLVAGLEREVERRASENVTVVHGRYDDPLLPEGAIDVAFFSGVFHHLDGPVDYFDRLRTRLSAAGRVAILDGPPDPLHALFMPFHFANAEKVDMTMVAAGYQRVAKLDFLPTMNFQIFTPR
jgi:SAM-dependent methyltransferase